MQSLVSDAISEIMNLTCTAINDQLILSSIFSPFYAQNRKTEFQKKEKRAFRATKQINRVLKLFRP